MHYLCTVKVFYVNKHYIQHYKRERDLNFRKETSGLALLKTYASAITTHYKYCKQKIGLLFIFGVIRFSLYVGNKIATAIYLIFIVLLYHLLFI